MAGGFGMLESKYDLSLKIAEPLIDKIRSLPYGSVVVASGTSCRHQIHDGTGRAALHVAQVLRSALQRRAASA